MIWGSRCSRVLSVLHSEPDSSLLFDAFSSREPGSTSLENALGHVRIESFGMTEVQRGASSALFGSRGHTSVSRGLSEFHARRPVLITAKGEAVLALPVEGIDGQRLAEFMALCGPVTPRLIITEQRAVALGLEASTPMALPLSAGDDTRIILALVYFALNVRTFAAKPASRAAAAAVELVKISQTLPAV